MAVEIDTFHTTVAAIKSSSPDTNSTDRPRSFNGTFPYCRTQKSKLVQLSDDLLLLIFLEYCDRISAFTFGLTCRKLVDLVHGEFYRKASQHGPASVVSWAVQRGIVATLDRLSYHLAPGEPLELDTHSESLISPVSWSGWKRYPNGNMYRYFSRTDHAIGLLEEGLVDLNGVLLNRKQYSTTFGSALQQHNLSGWTPIHIAALFGNADMVEYLGQGPRTPIFYAEVSDEPDTILPRMVRLGADINQKVGSSQLSLLAYLCSARCYRLALSLLWAGAKASFKTTTRKTPLHLCANLHSCANVYRYAKTSWTRQDLVNIIQALVIEGGVDPNTKDRAGNTFLHYAAKTGREIFVGAYEALASLIGLALAPASWGPPPHGNGTTTNGGGPKVVFDVDAQDGRGETVLMVACDMQSHVDYRADALPRARAAIQVFLETLRPSTGLKDARGRRVTDRLCRRVGKKGSTRDTRSSARVVEQQRQRRQQQQQPRLEDDRNTRKGAAAAATFILSEAADGLAADGD
ncbi:hypothetical protein PG994_003537 [Apiospora phragmitis]|uniref:Ankyrin repeat protein n=1 Tax=Apiospora phragmitis TaxID=2905665 RepID=A0ABR1W1H0_9PEZI